MITIRTAEGRFAAKGDARPTISERAARVPVERIDVYAATDAAMLGVAWTDGSTGICDWPNARDCVDWLRSQAWATGKIRVHFSKGVRPIFPDLTPTHAEVPA